MVALAGVLAIVLLTSVGVAVLLPDTADAPTVLLSGANSMLSLPDGTTRRVVVGETVPLGATVEAGVSGAVLGTDGRRVHLGQATSVTVVDGARQTLLEGFVLVDANDGPGVAMGSGAATVTAREDSLVRIDNGTLLRVGVLDGDAASVQAVDRRADIEVPRFYQVQISPTGLIGEPTPLLLTGDTYERDLAPGLTAADQDLNALSRQLSLAGPAGSAVLSSLAAAVPGSGEDTPVGERALAYLVATTIDADLPLTDRNDRVRDLRAAGGSWGVVAAIVETTPNAVSASLGMLLQSTVEALPQVLPSLGPSTNPSAANPSGTGSSPGASAGPTGPGTPSPGPTAGPTARPTPSGSPGPSPSPDGTPITGIGPVDAVVDDLLAVLAPSPPPGVLGLLR